MLIEKPRIPIKDVLLLGLLPSFLKVWIYRLKGYRIGKGVSIGLGSVIKAEHVEIGDDTSIGFLTIIRGKDIKLGSRVQIGSTTFLDTPYLEIGDGSRINEQVFVGGLQFPDSKLIIGRNCQIMQMSFINPARSITIGDDTGIGGHSLIFGHTSWLSQFEGYPVDFQPIEIGKSVSLAWRVFVLPGTTIGDGAVVGANSLVSGKVQPRCLTIGFPARVVAKAPEFPREITLPEKVTILKEIMEEMARYFRLEGFDWKNQGADHYISAPGRRWFQGKPSPWKMRVVFGETIEKDIPSMRDGLHLLLSLEGISVHARKMLQDAGIAWIEIANKERSLFTNNLADEVSLFLQRYGVRTLRVRAS